MSVKYLSQAWLTTHDLAGNHLLVLLALADWANDDGLCWPSVPHIASKARVCERTARYILRDLEARGFIEVHQERGLNHTNHYILHLPGHLSGSSSEKPQPQNLQSENLQNLQKGQNLPVLGRDENLQNLQIPAQNLQKEQVLPVLGATENLQNLQKGQTLPLLEPSPSDQNLQTPPQNLQSGAAKPAIAVAPKPSLVNRQLNRQYSSISSNRKNANLENRDLTARRSSPPPSSAPPPSPSLAAEPVPGKPANPASPATQSGLDSPSPVSLLPRSSYITSVVSDYSHQLGDQDHMIQNVNQALRLWSHSGLSEQRFAQLLHDARLATRKHQTRPLSDTMRNKMAYFFAVLRDMVYRPPPTPPTPISE